MAGMRRVHTWADAVPVHCVTGYGRVAVGHAAEGTFT